jgi:hypothetical protein
VLPPDAGPAWRAAVEYGFDMSLVEDALRMTPEQRLAEHQQVIDFFLEVQAAGVSHEPRTAGVPPAGSPSVSLGVGTGGETPPEPAAEDGRGTVALVHGDSEQVRSEPGISHGPE